MTSSNQEICQLILVMLKPLLHVSHTLWVSFLIMGLDRHWMCFLHGVYAYTEQKKSTYLLCIFIAHDAVREGNEFQGETYSVGGWRLHHLLMYEHLL